jgi:hypothetical protein
VSVTIIPVISLIDSIGTGAFQGYQIFNFDKKGNLFIADIYNNSWHYFAYNSALVAKSSISNLGLKYPYAIDFDSLGNLFTISQDGVFKVDSVGVQIDTLSGFANNENKDLLFYENFVWITSGIIAKISTDGKTIDSTSMISADGLTFNNDTLLVGGNGSVIRLYDKNLNNVGNWQLDFHSSEIAWSLTKDEKGNIYIAGYHSNPDIYEILIYDSSRKYQGKISLDYLVKYFKVRDNKLYTSANGIIKVYQIR